jgi:hypothetical protein
MHAGALRSTFARALKETYNYFRFNRLADLLVYRWQLVAGICSEPPEQCLRAANRLPLVAASQPLRSIRRRQQRRDLWPGQKRRVYT